MTITVERTEVIDDKTYYVITGMPANWPPAPPHFIAGKKLRWEGTHLMERTSDGEHAIFRNVSMRMRHFAKKFTVLFVRIRWWSEVG